MLSFFRRSIVNTQSSARKKFSGSHSAIPNTEEAHRQFNRHWKNQMLEEGHKGEVLDFLTIQNYYVLRNRCVKVANCEKYTNKKIELAWHYKILSGELTLLQEVLNDYQISNQKINYDADNILVYLICFSGNVRFLTLAIQHNVNFLQTINGKNVLHYAALSGDKNMFAEINKLNKKLNWNLPIEGLIVAAIQSEDLNMVQEVLNSGEIKLDKNLNLVIEHCDVSKMKKEALRKIISKYEEAHRQKNQGGISLAR